MVLSHNCFSFEKARFLIFELVSFLWRTQSKNISGQSAAGANWFDVRVRRSGNKWRVCHGLVDFKTTFDSLKEILDYFAPYGQVRIILERGDDSQFRAEYSDILSDDRVRQIVIKKNWVVFKDNGPWHGVDYTYKPYKIDESLKWNIKHFKLSTIKRWARQHNEPVTEEKKRPGVVYTYDYL